MPRIVLGIVLLVVFAIVAGVVLFIHGVRNSIRAEERLQTTLFVGELVGRWPCLRTG